ncbi:MAG TPA: ABC transporter ATP-binding protein [Candidatus Eremiobacteraceae bacterium]|nr:ABC transporter ATP-binding protein [Candidatus Eremiobacteraceae bacterium]
MVDSSVAIRFDGVVKRFAGANRPAVDGVSLDIPREAFVVVVGPSGCGKTTLMRTVNRLVTPSSGSVSVNGTDVAAADPIRLRRGIGYVIQNTGLFGHMTVAENVAIVPGLLGWDAPRIDARVDELLELVHLPAHEYRSRRPRELSGGQQQRVGLARALAADPAILLMDEPFGAVDAIERAHLQDEIAALQSRLHKTVVFVTHDVDEAFRLADIIVIMRDGRVEQSAAPAEVLARPASPFVVDLVGARDVVRRMRALRAIAAIDPQTAGRPGLPAIADQATLGDALAALLDGADMLEVRDPGGAPLGVVTVASVLAAARRV